MLINNVAFLLNSVLDHTYLTREMKEPHEKPLLVGDRRLDGKSFVSVWHFKKPLINDRGHNPVKRSRLAVVHAQCSLQNVTALKKVKTFFFSRKFWPTTTAILGLKNSTCFKISTWTNEVRNSRTLGITFRGEAKSTKMSLDCAVFCDVLASRWK